ncbi:ATP-binding protein [Williamsia phyllosphaerae]|nr:LuxR C-terminal-related transcriptional regulator [Williamsia phyllosphaerae]
MASAGGTTGRLGTNTSPSLTRFIARRRDLASVAGALTGSRLLTLTGVGGVGKTRLALEFARRAHDFPDGVWMVRLSDIETGAAPESVESALIAALDIPDMSATSPRGKLLLGLRAQTSLILLDNCEHLMPTLRVLIPEVLREAPGVKIIATSRESLGVAGETLHHVAPLDVPESGLTVPQLNANPSVALLLDRARAIDSSIELTEDNKSDFVTLCRLLDGIPLALELAAVKLRVLGIDQVVRRFGFHLTALEAPPGATTDSRHRSLRAMVDWSYRLCTPETQALWRRISVCTSDVDIELIESMAAADVEPPDLLGLVESLVSQSILLTERDGGEMRYRLPAPLRDYGLELAESSGEIATFTRDHREALSRRAEQAFHGWCSDRQRTLLRQMRMDHPGYVAAIEWSLTTPGEQAAGLRLVARLRWHWLSGGLLAEGRIRSDAALARVSEPGIDRAQCLFANVWIALIQGDPGASATYLADLSSVAERLADPRIAVDVVQGNAMLALFTGDISGAIEGFEQAAQRYASISERYMQLTAGYLLASAHVLTGDPRRALEASEQVIRLSEATGEGSARSYALWVRGLAQWQAGSLDDAQRSVDAALAIQAELLDSICTALCMHLLACIAFDRGDVDRADELSRVADRTWSALGTSLEAFGAPLADLLRERIPRQHTPDAPVVAAPVGASQQHPSEGLAQVMRTRARAVSSSSITQILTKREAEVAALVTDGLSNRDIAARLTISKRTADGHVERILAKLDLTSRHQVAGWLARNGDISTP